LSYEIFWEFVPAGTAVLQVLPMETIHNTSAYHFAITVKSNEMIDKFYKVRDSVEGYADAQISHSVLYKKKQQEGKHKGDITVTFDWEKSQTQFSNFGKKLKPVLIPPGTFDPLSVLYAFRLRKLMEDTTFETPVTDGKKLAVGRARVLTREKIRVKSGEYDTFLVEPDLKHVGGVFNKSKDAKLHVWVTSDATHIPVKVMSSVVIGRFTAELVSIERNYAVDDELSSNFFVDKR
jgi:hypothetical protein